MSLEIVLSEGVECPEYMTDGAAGMDLSAHLEKPLTLEPKTAAMVSTGVAVIIPKGYVGLLFIRSGTSKKGLNLANSVGVIDSDYRGVISAFLYNISDGDVTITNRERIVQLVVVPFVKVTPVVLKEMPMAQKTERGEGGFGSTGA